MIPDDLHVRVDRSLPEHTIIVSSYSVLDMIEEGVERLAPSPAPVVKPAPRRTPRAPAQPRKRRKNRRGSNHKPRRIAGAPSVKEALAAYEKRGQVLEDVERYVFGRYYGANGHHRASLGKIGDRIGYSGATISRVLAKAHRGLGLPYSKSQAAGEVQYDPLRKAMKIVPGQNETGTVVAGKVDPNEVRRAVKQNMEGRR